MTPELLLIATGFVGIGFLVWYLRPRTSGDTDIEIRKRDQLIDELKAEVSGLKTENVKLSENNKMQFAAQKNVESDLKALSKERDRLSSEVSKWESKAEQRQAKYEEMVGQLESAKKSLEDERMRVRREDEERLAQMEAERDRIWAEHEQSVISLMTDLCKQPQLNFDSFDNNHLPEGFHGQLKPDFLVSFLGQYVIFDAKVSKADNLNVYVKDQVKKTAQKVKGNDKIYPTIFLVVPTAAIEQIKTHHFYEEGFHFFVVSPEAVAPILSGLKRIETYEFAEQMDPQERENIIDLLAAFDFHISQRNAADFLLMQHGLHTLKKAESMDPDLLKEVVIRKAKMRQLSLNTAEQKQLAANPEALEEQLRQLIEPTAQIAKEDIEQLKGNR